MISGKHSAVVEGSDYLLPHFSRNEIGRFYTNRVTQPGDSGAVLVDDAGLALGMASSVSTTEYFLPMSVWMYMPGVLLAVQSTIVQTVQSLNA